MNRPVRLSKLAYGYRDMESGYPGRIPIPLRQYEEHTLASLGCIAARHTIDRNRILIFLTSDSRLTKTPQLQGPSDGDADAGIPG